MAITKSCDEQNKLLDDDWELPLPAGLQAIVRNAPATRARLDDYFKRAVERTWVDPAAKALAVAVYMENPVGMSTKHLPPEVRRSARFFAAEMRVLREKCRE